MAKLDHRPEQDPQHRRHRPHRCRARPPPPSTCSTTPGPSTSSAASTRAPPRPTTTPRSRSAASPSTRACIPFQWRGCTVNLIDTPGPRRFHRRGRAEPARPRRLRRRLRRPEGRRGAVGDRLAAGEQVRRPAAGVRQQDGRRRGQLRQRRRAQVRDRARRARPVPVVIPIGAGSIKDSDDAVPRHHRPDRDEGAVLRRRRLRARRSAPTTIPAENAGRGAGSTARSSSTC